jgi:hypothetical protein
MGDGRLSEVLGVTLTARTPLLIGRFEREAADGKVLRDSMDFLGPGMGLGALQGLRRGGRLGNACSGLVSGTLGEFQ